VRARACAGTRVRTRVCACKCLYLCVHFVGCKKTLLTLYVRTICTLGQQGGNWDRDIRSICREHNIVYQAYSLNHAGNGWVYHHRTVLAIAEKYVLLMTPHSTEKVSPVRSKMAAARSTVTTLHMALRQRHDRCIHIGTRGRRSRSSQLLPGRAVCCH
jgi:hypothetical protein